MRWMVYLLLAANLGLLTWNLQTHGAVPPPRAPAPPPQVPGSASQLPLLSELGEDTLRERAGAGEPQAVAAATPGGASGGEAGPTPDIYNVVGQAPAGTPGPAGQDAAAPGPGTCLTVGPLDENAPVDEVHDWLEARGAAADVRTDERREVALYWIYFPPRSSREAAIEEVERMRGKGISDVIVVPKGDMANAISLGVFSRPDTRDRRLSELASRGYQPNIAPRYRTKLATWIDVSAGEGSLVRDGLAGRWPDLQLTEHPCPGEQIAAGGADSYNSSNDSPPPAPRRFEYSGPAASPGPGPDR